MDMLTAVGLLGLALGVGVYGSIIGAGGAFLVVAGLTLVFDLGSAEAVGTSVVTTLFIQLTGAYTYGRKGLVDWASAKWFVLGSVPVAFASAAWLANRIPQRTFDLAVGVMLLALAAFVVLVRSPSVSDDETLEPKRALLTSSGGAIGVLSGGFGVGAGLVSVPLFARLQRLSAHRAAATTTATGAAAGIASSLGHAVANNPEWIYLPILIIGAVVGGRIGATNASRLSSRTVLALLALGLVAAGLPLLVRGAQAL